MMHGTMKLKSCWR